MLSSLRRLTALLASLIAPLMALAFLLLGWPAPAQAANVVVNNCSQAGLHAAILAAGNSGRVTFDCTSGGPVIILASTEQISHDITIDGGGVITISGGSSVRLFSVPGSQKATLANLGLVLGSAGQGGAVNVNGFLVARHDTFAHNDATSSGGAIRVTSQGTAQVSDSLFFSNTAQAGAAIHNSGRLEVGASIFSQNTAFSGGALNQDGGSASISQTLFAENRSAFGGAIGADGQLALANDEFNHNHALYLGLYAGLPGGGALYLQPGAQATLDVDRFFSNTAEVGVSDGAGGAILNHGSLTATLVLLEQNHAQRAGGALFNGTAGSRLLNVYQSTFLGNSALGAGGAISNTGALYLHTSTLVSNTASDTGGALANAGTLIVEFSQLGFNRAPSGGAVRNQGQALFVLRSTLYSNTALTGSGGAVLNNGGLALSSDTLLANAAPNGNGAAVQNSGSTTPTLSLGSNTIVSNTAASGGAAVRVLTGNSLAFNNIYAFNTPENCQGTLTSYTYSLQFPVGFSCGTLVTNTNPLLGPPQDNGGPRVGVFGAGLITLLPQSGSPAINASQPLACSNNPGLDERGFAFLGPCDIGAVERVFPVELPIIRR